MESSSRRFSRIKKLGVPKKVGEDAYHSLLKMPWLQFIGTFLLFVFIFNFIFAVIYWWIPGSIKGADGSLFECFAFSVQTFSTVGYGVFSPANQLTHIVVIIESALAVLVTAVLTGVVYAKFSRPRARVIFSKNVLIAKMDGKDTLIFRAGNLRQNQIIEAEAKVVMLKSIKTQEGNSLRKQFDLRLHRNQTSFFALSWVLMHTVYETSPLYGLDISSMKGNDIEIGVSLTGHDETFSQTVFANCIYSLNDFVMGKHFHDIIVNDKNGRAVAVDYTKFDVLV